MRSCVLVVLVNGVADVKDDCRFPEPADQQGTLSYDNARLCVASHFLAFLDADITRHQTLRVIHHGFSP